MLGPSLVVQWERITGDVGSVPGRGTKIPPAKEPSVPQLEKVKVHQRPSQNQINQSIKVSAGHQVKTSSMIQSCCCCCFLIHRLVCCTQKLCWGIWELPVQSKSFAPVSSCVQGQACCESTHGHQGLVS